MDFTVYHATGTLFLTSIISEGLKPVDLDSKYKVREALSLLLKIVPSEYRNDIEKYIICMSNNLDSRDAFIIIGVNEDDNYNLRDVSEDNGRKQI